MKDKVISYVAEAKKSMDYHFRLRYINGDVSPSYHHEATVKLEKMLQLMQKRYQNIPKNIQ